MKNKNFHPYSKRKVWNRIVFEELGPSLSGSQASTAVSNEQLPTTKRCRIVFLIESFGKTLSGIASNSEPQQRR
jgi:hypothetical protein